MMLTSGTRLGAYEIVSPLGAGGMGEVYRARDTRLKREVALKVLPASVAGDPERLARFQREAEVLASLNHPHIAAIHGLEESSAAGVPARALVLELVEGETLAERIARGPVPLDEALAIARQIAAALEAAHEHGIIHRDLKPANIKITPDGVVKVLDFGLAKLAGPSDASHAGPAEAGHYAGARSAGLQAGLSMSPTLASPALTTGVGALLGTAAYMSPEQARGRAADKRSDIWGFGCVLYEMLTGRRAFEGDDVTDTMAAILRGEPEWTQLPAATPPVVGALLKSCLERDAAKRPASLAVASFVFDRAADPIGRSTAGDVTAAVDEVRRDTSRRSARRIVAAALLSAAAAAFATGGAVWVATRPQPPRVARTILSPAGAATSATFTVVHPLAVTPDGNKVIYIGGAATSIFVRALDTLEPVTLVTGTALSNLFVSPDGAWVGFTDASNEIKKVAITGGTPITVARPDGVLRGASWAADDTIVFATSARETGLQRVSADGGRPEILTRPDRANGEVDHFWPELLPDGGGVLYTAWTGDIETSRITIRDLPSGSTTDLVRGGTDARLTGSGHLTYAGAGGTVQAVGFDAARRQTTGAAVQVLSGSVYVLSVYGSIALAVARDGTAVYLPGGESAGVELVSVDLQGGATPLGLPRQLYSIPRVSPDGTRLAVTIEDERHDVWVYDLARRIGDRLTPDAGADRDQVWTSDGRRIAYHATGRPGGAGIFIRPADGTGAAERLTTGEHRPMSFSPDGRFLVGVDLGSGSVDVFAVELGGEGRVRPLLNSSARENLPAISPDGRWIAYHTTETGTNELFVRPFPDVASGRWRISTSGAGGGVVWAPDGSALYYAIAGAMMRVRVSDGPPSKWGIPEMLFEGPYLLPSGPRGFDITPDGRRFVMIRQDAAQQTAGIVLVQHWVEEIARRVPAR